MSKNLFKALMRIAENKGHTAKDLGAFARKKWGNGFVRTLPDDTFSFFIAWLAVQPAKKKPMPTCGNLRWAGGHPYVAS